MKLIKLHLKEVIDEVAVIESEGKLKSYKEDIMKAKRLVTLVGSVCLILALVALSLMSCAEPTPTGGILKVSTGVTPMNLGDPPAVTSSLLPGSPCIETFLHFDETGAPIPWLATGWEVNANAKTIILTLREGVKFHDGTDFNAEAAEYNLERYAASASAMLNTVESVDVVDDYTVRLNLSEFDNSIVMNLARNAGLVASPTALETKGPEWVDTHPVGTGPFKFVSWERDVAIKYERFDDYWQKDKPYLNGVEWVIIADPMTQLATFQRGDVDVLLGVSPKDAKDIEASGKYNFGRLPATIMGLASNAGQPDSIFTDIKVRQAVSYAIDSQTICDVIGYGYWDAANQLASSSGWGYNSSVVGYPYNPEKARQLLAEAGYPDGFKTKILCPNAPKDTVDAFTAIQGYLKEVGIDAEIDIAEMGRYFQGITGGWEDLIVYSAGYGSPDDAFRQKLQLHSSSRGWVSILHVPEVDALIMQALSTPDFETKKALAQEVNKAVADEYCVVSFVYIKNNIAARDKMVHDDAIYEVTHNHFTPEDTWIEE